MAKVIVPTVKVDNPTILYIGKSLKRLAKRQLKLLTEFNLGLVEKLNNLNIKFVEQSKLLSLAEDADLSSLKLILFEPDCAGDVVAYINFDNWFYNELKFIAKLAKAHKSRLIVIDTKIDLGNYTVAAAVVNSLASKYSDKIEISLLNRRNWYKKAAVTLKRDVKI